MSQSYFKHSTMKFCLTKSLYSIYLRYFAHNLIIFHPLHWKGTNSYQPLDGRDTRTKPAKKIRDLAWKVGLSNTYLHLLEPVFLGFKHITFITRQYFCIYILYKTSYYFCPCLYDRVANNHSPTRKCE